MHLVVGVVLVLLTWAVCVGLAVSTGLLPVLASSGRLDRREALRGALWWGLLVLATFAIAVNLVLPLHSPATAALLLLAVVVLGVPGWALWRSRRRRRARALRGTSLLIAAAVIAAGTLAVAALGPVTNYDSGLYHLQAIRYAAEFATVPGLASVFFPLGYATAEFPLAALIGLGPWGLEGFRLVNGAMVVLALVELVLRWRRPRSRPGALVLLVGLMGVAITMLPLADYWVTSPTQDSAVLVLTVVASAYLADVVASARGERFIGTLGALILMLVMLRPTMAAYGAAAAIIVLIVVWFRRRAGRRSEFARWGGVVGAAAVIVAVAMTARDYVLSGWVQYPLSLHAFTVEWLAPDPTSPRLATLGAARDPDNLWSAAESWDWVGPWLGRLPGQWETYAALGLALVAVVCVTVVARVTTLRGRALLLAMAPSVVAVLFWWGFTPPSFRFAWGPVFTLATIPIGWSVWRWTKAQAHALDAVAARRPGGRRIVMLAMVGASLVIVGVSVVSLAVRIDYDAMTQDRAWFSLPPLTYRVAPINAGDVAVGVNEAGLEFRAPRSGDQCWLAFPTCSPQMLETLRLRGDDIPSGYLP